MQMLDGWSVDRIEFSALRAFSSRDEEGPEL
jgi:hypothetical protein